VPNELPRRPYRLKRRAELQDHTRLRITEAAVELHGTLGPEHTTISAVAQQAGVRRATVYRHFPTEDDLFAACSTHWIVNNPQPDLNRWRALLDPHERLEAALTELYAYYGRTHRMLTNLLRDEATVPVVRRLMVAYWGYLSAAREVLMAGRGLDNHRGERVAAVVSHALALPTWRSLVLEGGLDDSEAVELMSGLVSMAAGEWRPAPAGSAAERPL
jgi:AcrR family transcriptional regulator